MNGFELIAQGAEARVYKGVYLGRPALIKERFEKKYRHVDLDTRITKDRTKAECRAMVRAKAAGETTRLDVTTSLRYGQIMLILAFRFKE